MAGSSKSQSTFGVARVEMEIPIAAAPKRVWQALVGETSDWWNKDFLTSPSAQGFVIEPKLGGKAYEDWGQGAGLIWYTVIGVEAPRLLMMQGLLTAAFGGPANTILELRLRSAGKRTVLQLSDTVYGNVGEGKRDQTREGWSILFEGGLKQHLERK